MPQVIPITAIVVSCDEAGLLERCLPALRFCDELIVVDMECTDGTVAVARRYGARVVPHVRVPFIESAQEWLSTIASHDWILTVDPDEVVDARLAKELTALLPVLPEEVAVIELPWQFYFGRHALSGTYWGGRNWKSGCCFHRQRVMLDSILHQKAVPRPGCISHRIPWFDGHVLHHYWMEDYRQFMGKHRRYIAAEGQRHQRLGHRFSWLRMAWVSVHSFVWSVLKKQGWRDGHVGIGLSAFYAWYVGSGWMALARLEKDQSLG
ncbi:MAG: glycosyltransferase family 2 protein [Prosthecobacter sp.]|nr:glycosyltransferase family 2 protein [Prosthecobacter sp.]